MTRAEALEVAKLNYTARGKAMIEFDFRGVGVEAEINQRFGYRHGWYIVGDFAFNNEDITGQPYDANQGGWAYL